MTDSWRFQVGDRVEVVNPHTYHGTNISDTYVVGDVGTVVAASDFNCHEETKVRVVQLDGQGSGDAHFIDEACLDFLVTPEQVDAAIASIAGSAGSAVVKPWKLDLTDEQATAVGHVIWFLTSTGQLDAAAAVETEFGVVM